LFALPKLVGRHVLERAAGHRKHRLGLATISLDRYGLAGYAASKAGVMVLTRWRGGGDATACASTRGFTARRPGADRILSRGGCPLTPDSTGRVRWLCYRLRTTQRCLSTSPTAWATVASPLGLHMGRCPRQPATVYLAGPSKRGGVHSDVT
jgi:hypothetical protein